MRIPQITGLYYITHVNNIPSILRRGILSHERVLEEGIDYTPIYDEDIVRNRRDKKAPDGNSLWHFFVLSIYHILKLFLFNLLTDLTSLSPQGMRPTPRQRSFRRGMDGGSFEILPKTRSRWTIGTKRTDPRGR